MRFIIDENLPPDLVVIFRSENLEAYHVNEMKGHQKQRIIDDQLRRLSIQKGYIIVTKDDDFVKSYVDRKVPNKLIFIHGLENKESLLTRLKEVIPEIKSLIVLHDFIEIGANSVKLPFAD